MKKTNKPQPGAYPFRDKPMYMKRVKAHRLADELVRGIGWEINDQARGCAIGCTLHTYDHKQYPVLLGVPVQIAHLEDWLFENLPKDHLKWPERFLDAIIPGSDLTMVYPQWVCRMLTRRLESLNHGQEVWLQKCREAIGTVRDLWSNGFPSAASAARSAASAEIQRQADDLIELLESAPML